MAETNKAKFFQSDFRIEYEKNVFEVNGLFSEYGITKLHVISRPPPFIDIVFGHSALIRLGDLTFNGLLIKQFTELGSNYEVRFVELSAEQKNALRERVEREGMHPGWVRKYPRISVKEALALGLPALNFCVMRFLGTENFSSVLNFTLEGIRVEVTEGEMTEAKVGTIVHFDLMTNAGETIAGLAGEIRNISVHEYEEGAKLKVHKSLGIKLVSVSATQKQKYGDLIRDYCQAVLKRTGSAG